MNLVAGAFLAGLAVLAVPLLLHRLKERSPAETTVSSLMLMRPLCPVETVPAR